MSPNPVPIDYGQLHSRHAVAFTTGARFRDQDLHFVSLTAIAIPDLRGDSESRWKGGSYLLQFKIPVDQLALPPTPDDDGGYLPIFHIKNWTVYAGLNAILNINASNSSGHAVDAFQLVKPPSGFYITHDEVHIRFDLAARDTDAFLHRFACEVELLLYFIGYAERIP